MYIIERGEGKDYLSLHIIGKQITIYTKNHTTSIVTFNVVLFIVYEASTTFTPKSDKIITRKENHSQNLL